MTQTISQRKALINYRASLLDFDASDDNEINAAPPLKSEPAEPVALQAGQTGGVAPIYKMLREVLDILKGTEDSNEKAKDYQSKHMEGKR